MGKITIVNQERTPVIRESAALPEVFTVEDVRKRSIPATAAPAVLPQPPRSRSRPRSAITRGLSAYLLSRRGYLICFTLLTLAGITAGVFIFSGSGEMRAQFGADAAGYFATAQGKSLPSLLLLYFLGDGLLIITTALTGLTVLAIPANALCTLWRGAQFGFIAAALLNTSAGIPIPQLVVYIAATAVSSAVFALCCAEGCTLSRYVVRDPKPLRASLGAAWKKYMFRMLLFTLFSFLCFIMIQMSI